MVTTYSFTYFICCRTAKQKCPFDCLRVVQSYAHTGACILLVLIQADPAAVTKKQQKNGKANHASRQKNSKYRKQSNTVKLYIRHTNIKDLLRKYAPVSSVKQSEYLRRSRDKWMRVWLP